MRMHEELQAYLDGELRLEDLPAELRSEAEAWNGMLATARRIGPAGAPLGFDRKVMARVREEQSRASTISVGRGLRAFKGGFEWLARPRPIRVSPLAAAAVAAGVLFLTVGPGLGGGPGDTPGEAAAVYVQFVVDAPRAQSVELVGDFNGWQPTIALEDLDGDGVWTGKVPLEPGVHEYMFVLDGTAWVPDPNAESYADDGFGRENSVVSIPEPVSGA